MHFIKKHDLLSFHKIRIFDFSLVAVSTFYTLYLALHCQIFASPPGRASRPEALEWNELCLVVGVLAVGLVWALDRLWKEQRASLQRDAAQKEIAYLAFHDPLTGLGNRRRFSDVLQTVLATPLQPGANHGLIVLDLNDFKRVNDVYGHGAGDEVLVEVARRVAQVVRGGDTLVRLGGDEFAVIAPQMIGAGAVNRLAERIVAQFEAPILAGGAEQVVGSAIGIALEPEHGFDASELLRKADIALYEAKRHRGSSIRLFDPSMSDGPRDYQATANGRGPVAQTTTALEEAIDATLAARRAINDLGADAERTWLVATDILLIRMGRRLAATRHP